jgi:hypothetical protein
LKEPLSAGPVDECEVKVDGEWVTIGIRDAVMLRKAVLRCQECGGRIRARMNYMEGAEPHFVHYTQHPGCSTTARLYRGVASRHPQALE